MNKLFSITLITLYFLTTSTWAMEEEESHAENTVYVYIGFVPRCEHLPGLKLPPEEVFYLYQDYRTCTGEMRWAHYLKRPPSSSCLSLEGKQDDEAWKKALKEYVRIEERPWEWDELIQRLFSPFISFLTADPASRQSGPSIIVKYKHLLELNLSDTHLKDRNPDLLRGILHVKHTPALQTLILSRNNLDDAWIEGTLAEGNHPLLKTLDLSHNYICIIKSEPWIRLCKGFTGLEKLNLRHNKIEGSSRGTLQYVFGKPGFFQSPRLPANLKELNLDGNPIAEDKPDLGNEILAASKPSFG